MKNSNLDAWIRRFCYFSAVLLVFGSSKAIATETQEQTYVELRNAQRYISFDSGITWQLIQEGVKIQETPQVVFREFREGVEMISHNGGITWENVSQPQLNPSESLDKNQLEVDLSIAEHSINQPLNIAPNPVREIARIEYNVSNDGNVQITMVDGLGQLVAPLVSETHARGLYSMEFAVDNLTNGIYYIRYSNENTTVTQKMVVYR